jgi:hypothetical protein
LRFADGRRRAVGRQITLDRLDLQDRPRLLADQPGALADPPDRLAVAPLPVGDAAQPDRRQSRSRGRAGGRNSIDSIASSATQKYFPAVV